MSDSMNPSGPGLLQVVSQCHELLGGLDAPTRTKAIKMLLLAFDEAEPLLVRGQGAGAAAPALSSGDREASQSAERVNRRSQGWLRKHGMSEDVVERVLDVENDYVLIGHLPGDSKREQAISCYLLTGIQAMLRTGDARFRDEDAIELCKREGCYDRANHAATRAQLGKRVSGDKESGFSLTSLGLDQGAELVKKMAAN